MDVLMRDPSRANALPVQRARRDGFLAFHADAAGLDAPPLCAGVGGLGPCVEVLVTHAEPLVRAGLVAVLSGHHDLAVTTHAIDDSGGPDHGSSGALSRVIVTDYVSAVQLLMRTTNDSTFDRQAKVLVVTRSDLEGNVASALRLGVRGYILIDTSVGKLVEGVRALASGLRYVCGEVTAPTGLATARGGLAPGALRRVRAHMEERLSGKVELRDLASIAGLSECHFSRAFKQSLGVPPHRYLMRRRIATAATMIEQTDRALTDISLDVGFSDQSHFTRVFTGMTGETPRAYRRRHR